MKRTASPRTTPLGNTGLFTPSVQQPVRVRSRSLPADTHFEPHAHPWAQLAYCATGIVQVTAAHAGLPAAISPDEFTYIVPPSRAVWIAPGAAHHITVREAAQFRTLYIHANAVPLGWEGCRMIVVSGLLREAIQALDEAAALNAPGPREGLLASLVLDEIARADAQLIGVPLPHPQHGDKRLRALCEAVMQAPAKRSTLAEWAADIGASERTVARLFRDELGLSYQQWRQQAVLAHALPLLARGWPVSEVAAATGYASDSAFSAMFKAAMGQSPSQFTRKKWL
ncbi:MAG: AraC family transcriptional regulator [Polaromonas sp.]|jgi:AraC-like DNA-binding protein|nr:AraC family transcriptional regulator [Polaromonas sp.]